MKVTTQDKKRVSYKYPLLMSNIKQIHVPGEYYHTGSIMLFTSNTSAIVMLDNDPNNSISFVDAIGTVLTGLTLKDFLPYKGKVTLEN